MVTDNKILGVQGGNIKNIIFMYQEQPKLLANLISKRKFLNPPLIKTLLGLFFKVNKVAEREASNIYKDAFLV